jgi:hypothetical protein
LLSSRFSFSSYLARRLLLQRLVSTRPFPCSSTLASAHPNRSLIANCVNILPNITRLNLIYFRLTMFSSFICSLFDFICFVLVLIWSLQRWILRQTFQFQPSCIPCQLGQTRLWCSTFPFSRLSSSSLTDFKLVFLCSFQVVQKICDAIKEGKPVDSKIRSTLDEFLLKKNLIWDQEPVPTRPPCPEVGGGWVPPSWLSDLGTYALF